MDISASKQSVTGIYGGTFDPVHIGHMRTAVEMLEQLRLTELRFIPSARPPHKQTNVAPFDFRLKMLEQAIHNAGFPAFVLDAREAGRRGPSYTVDTLQELKQAFPATRLVLIMGMDAWLTLPQWHRWQVILDLAHIAVLRRPGTLAEPPKELRDIMWRCRTDHPEHLHHTDHGLLYFADVTQFGISSSMVRSSLAADRSIRYLVPEAIQSDVEAYYKCQKETEG